MNSPHLRSPYGLLTAAALAALTLAGCGQYGDLYLPEEPQPPAPTAAPAAENEAPETPADSGAPAPDPEEDTPPDAAGAAAE